jgi:hypothetical protein
MASRCMSSLSDGRLGDMVASGNQRHRSEANLVSEIGPERAVGPRAVDRERHQARRGRPEPYRANRSVHGWSPADE